MAPSVSTVSSPVDGDDAYAPTPRASTDKGPDTDTLHDHPALRSTSNQHHGVEVTQRLLNEDGSRLAEDSVAGSIHEIKSENQVLPSQKPSWYHDWWLWEILGMIVSLGAIIGIIIILALYNGKPLRTWPSKITINTSLSVLSTISKVRHYSLASCRSLEFIVSALTDAFKDNTTIRGRRMYGTIEVAAIPQTTSESDQFSCY